MSAGGEVRYVFVASGHDSVLAAFRTIDQAAQRSAQVAGESAQQGARTAQKATTGRVSAEERAYQKIVKELENEAKAAERAAERKARAALAAERARERAAEASYRRIVRQLENEAKAAERAAERKAAADKRASLGAIAGLARKGLTLATGAAALALGTVGAAARESVQLGDVSRRLAISARGPGQELVDPRTLQREFENTALATPGISANDVAAGTQLFVSKTGDLDTARAMQRTFAVTASATGSEYSDIAGAAADIMQKFDIKGVQAMQQAFATLTFQGKKGAFELKDAASYFSEMAAAAQRFGVGSGPKALATLGGLAQIARTSTGSAAEASTAVQDMFSELVAKSHKLATKHGVDVFDKKGAPRDIKDVLVDTIGKVGGADLAAKKEGLQQVFGQRGSRAVSPLIAAFSTAALETKGNDTQKVAAGMKAVRAALEDAIDAPGTWADVVKDDAEAQRSNSAQLTAAWEELKAKTSAEVVPALVSLVPKLTKLTGAIDPAITAFGVMVDVLGQVVDFLVESNLIQRKPEKLSDAERKLKEFDDVLAAKGASATDEDRLHRAELVKNRDAAYDREFKPASGLRKSISQDEFVEDYIARRSHDFLTGQSEEEAAMRGRTIYERLLDDPQAERGQHDWAMARWFGDDSEGQRQLIDEMAEIATSGRTLNRGQGLRSGIGEGQEIPLDAPLQESLFDATAAVKLFAESLRQVQPQASILGIYAY